MGIDDFFNAIKEKCSSDEEYNAELLKARGFLLEDNSLALSDNSHPDDETYLNEILQRENLGEVKENKIIFSTNNIEKIFTTDSRISHLVAGVYGRQWGQFKNKKYAAKVPIRILEPFVARYIKAISACGVWTSRSCDGNHSTNSGRIYVEPDGIPSRTWHKVLCRKCLRPGFNLKWDDKCEVIRISNNDKWKTYIELNCAGAFLYNNRLILRQVKEEALEHLSYSRKIGFKREDLDVFFSYHAIKLLNKCNFFEEK